MKFGSPEGQEQEPLITQTAKHGIACASIYSSSLPTHPSLGLQQSHHARASLKDRACQRLCRKLRQGPPQPWPWCVTHFSGPGIPRADPAQSWAVSHHPPTTAVWTAGMKGAIVGRLWADWSWRFLTSLRTTEQRWTSLRECRLFVI